MIVKHNFSRFLLGLSTVWGLNSMLLVPAFAQSGGYRNWHIGRWMMGDWGMGWFGMIVVLSFWVIVVAGTVYFIRWLVQKTDSRGHSGGGPDSQAIEILKERYARGEITREEFASMKSDLLQ